MAAEAINPEVNNTIADLSGERVAENAAENYPRNFWSSLKNGHYRFATTGISVGLVIGAAVGAAVCALPFVGWALAPLVITAFAGTGALMGGESFGTTGAAATSRAEGLAEKHARILDMDAQGKGAVCAANDKLMETGRGHHYEQPSGRDKGKFYSLKSGLTGGALGAASGAALGVGLAITAGASHLASTAALAAATAEIPVLGAMTAGVAAIMPLAAPLLALAVAGAAVFGLFGLTFGIERNVLKSSLNQTDANIQGKLSFTDGPDLGRAQSRESDKDLAQHRLRRQAEIEKLEKSYNDRIFWGAVGGRFRGFGAVVPGVLAGAALGAIALGGMALAMTGGLAALPAAAALIVPVFAAAGGMLAMKVFAESGTEAGAEATARAIDNEFERNRALRAQGITPPKPKEAEDKWFNPKAALIAGLLGAAIGVALAPVLGVGTLALATGATVGAFSAHAIAASVLVSGIVGATYGLGGKTLKAISSPFMKLYDRVASHQGPESDITPEQQPARPVQVSEKITPEEMNRLNEKLEAGSGRSFAQASQAQAQATAVGVGA